MIKRKIPLFSPYLEGNEKKYLNDCLKSRFLSSNGEYVKKIEKKICSITDYKYSVSTNSGTSALQLALKLNNVENDDLVIIPSYTFIATANAVKNVGAEPFICDVCENYWTIDCNLLEKVLFELTEIKGKKLIHKKTGKVVKAIIPVGIFGYLPDIKKISELAKKFFLKIILDCAGSLFSTIHGKKIGKLNLNSSIISFNGNKIVSTGGGGMFLTNKKKIFQKARLIASTSKVGPNYDHSMVSYNFRMSNIQAAVGLAQLENIKEIIKNKRMISERYDKAFNFHKNTLAIPKPKFSKTNFWIYPIRITKNKNQIMKQILESGIGCSNFWKPIHLQKPYKNCIRSSQIISERIWNNIIILPNYASMKKIEIEYVINNVEKALSRNL